MNVERLFKVLVLGGAMLGCTSTSAPPAQTAGNAHKQLSESESSSASRSAEGTSSAASAQEFVEAQGCGAPSADENDNVGEGVQVSW